jgi:hypothetical protein
LYDVTEADFASGAWGTALAAGLQALEIAEERSYHRAAARTWFAILPIASALGERTLLERAAAWYERLEGAFPDSPYARLSRSAADILIEACGLPSTFRVDLERLGPSIAEGSNLPSWFEALDIVVADALASGRVVPARRALATFRTTVDRLQSAAARSALALLEARLLLAEGAGAAASEPLRILRAAAHPWPVLKCLRLLAERGPAGQAALEELRSLEASLGIQTTPR